MKQILYHRFYLEAHIYNFTVDVSFRLGHAFEVHLWNL